MNVDVSVNQQTAKLDLIFVRENGTNLLGRDWLKFLRLDWCEKSIRKKDSTCECQVQEILKKYQTKKYIRTWNRQAINFTGKLTLKEAQLRKAREELLEAIYRSMNSSSTR